MYPNLPPWEQPMKKLQYVRTRRQLFRAMSVGAASIPFLALAIKSASAQTITPRPAPIPTPRNSCFLKGTKISTPSGDRLVQDLRIGDEVQTLAGRKVIRWIGYNKFTKEERRAWQERSVISNVVDVRDPIQIAYDQLAQRAEALLV